MIDWPRLLTKHGVEFIEHGPSTSKGNIYVHCPWCGADDQGHHMGISIHGKGWGCWRNDSHRGKSSVKLVMALLEVSRARALDILGMEEPKLEGPQGLKAKWDALQLVTEEVTKVHILKFPGEIKPLHYPIRIEFCEYLEDRNYPSWIQPDLSRRYNLRWALKGKWKYRLIFPVYTKEGLVTWTGRSITKGVEPRYDTLTVDPEKAYLDKYYSKANIKDCLFNEKWLYKHDGGRVLIVSEGPFDAMRLDWSGHKYLIHGTCIFGKTISAVQLEKLYELGKRYDKRFVLLDPDAQMDVFQMQQRIKAIGFKPLSLVKYGVEDPGSLNDRQAKGFLRKEVLTR